MLTARVTSLTRDTILLDSLWLFGILNGHQMALTTKQIQQFPEHKLQIYTMYKPQVNVLWKEKKKKKKHVLTSPIY